jgi:hypothetical protein
MAPKKALTLVTEAQPGIAKPVKTLWYNENEIENKDTNALAHASR